MIMGKKIKWVALPVITFILAGAFDTQSNAAMFQSLREARDAAWDTYYKEDIVSNNSLEKGIIIDGAVDEKGGAKIAISDWTDKAIPKDGQELSVYASLDTKKAAGKVYGDTIMSVLSVEGDWLQIQSGYLKGYVKADEVHTGKKAEEWAVNVCPEQIISDIWNTEVRNEPDSDANIVEYMDQRSSYDIIETRSGWIEIKTTEGFSGFVEEKNVKRVRSIHFGRSLIDMGNPQAPFIKERISEKEKHMLAAIIYCESRGEIFEGQVAVGSVVMNRMKSKDFPDTVEEVIFQDGQFEPVLMNRYEKVLQDESQISPSCFEAVDVILQGGNNIGEALYFRIGGGGIQIGSHGFY